MKIYLSILTCLLLSCSNSKENTEKPILCKTVFTTILKELHLEKASFELNTNMKPTEIKLIKACIHIYKQHETSEEEFIASLNYYSENPEILEEIYADVLEQLANEKSKLDPQETN